MRRRTWRRSSPSSATRSVSPRSHAACRDRRQAHHRQRRRGLAGTGLADHAPACCHAAPRTTRRRPHAPQLGLEPAASSARKVHLQVAAPTATARYPAAARSCGRPPRARARSTSQQAAPWPSALRNSGGTSLAQRGMACGQRSRKAQPVPNSQMDGTTPAISTSSARSLAAGCCPVRAGRQSAPGCTDAAAALSTSAQVPCSMMRPAYITITRSAISATAPMSWVMNMMAVPLSRCRLAQQIEDLRLHRDVERGGRLVGDQDVGPAGQRHRDHHALAHAAGQLVRVFVDAALGRRNAHLAQHLDGAARAPPRPSRPACRRSDLADLVADA